MEEITKYSHLNHNEMSNIFNLIFKDKNIAWWIYDIDGEIVKSSASRAEISGFNTEEFPVDFIEILEMIHPDDYDFVVESYKSIFTSKINLFDLKYRAKTKFGNWIWLNDRWEIIRNENEEAKFIYGVIINQTEVKEIENLLVEKSKNLQELTNNLPVGVYQINTAGLILFANNHFAQIFGYSVQQLVMTKNFKNFFIYADEKEKCFRNWSNSSKDETYMQEYRLSQRNGSTIWVRDIGNAIRESDGNIIFFFGALIDITDQKKISDTIKYRESQLQAVYLNIPDIILQLDINGRIFFSNKLSSNAYIRQLIGSNFIDAIDNVNRVIIRDKLYILMEIGTTQEHELITDAFSADNRKYHAKFSAVTTDDTISAIVVILTDITYMKNEYNIYDPML